MHISDFQLWQGMEGIISALGLDRYALHDVKQQFYFSHSHCHHPYVPFPTITMSTRLAGTAPASDWIRTCWNISCRSSVSHSKTIARRTTG